MNMAVRVTKWGNSQGIRLPQSVLQKIGVRDLNNAKLLLDVKNDEIILKKEKMDLEDYFKGYENQKYPFEIIDKGGAIGKELY